MSTGNVVIATVSFTLAGAALILAALTWVRKRSPFGDKPLPYGYRQATAIFLVFALAAGLQGVSVVVGSKLLRVAASLMLTTALVLNLVLMLRERRRWLQHGGLRAVRSSQ